MTNQNKGAVGRRLPYNKGNTMKFTCIPKLGKQGGGVVWDAEAGKVLARFDKNGEFETQDDDVIAKLTTLGYTTLDAAPEKPAKRGGKKRDEEE